MNADTQRDIQNILNNGFYFEGQTLGDGGWSSPELRSATGEWKRFVMYDESVEVCLLTAKDDETALQALRAKFNPEYVHNCEVVEYIVTLRHIN